MSRPKPEQATPAAGTPKRTAPSAAAAQAPGQPASDDGPEAVTARYGFDDNLGYLLNRCGAQMAGRFERALAPFDVSLAQWGALLAIHDKGTASPSDVAARVGTDRGATTRLLARMEAKGLVARREHPSDARSVVLSLTPRAASLMPRLLALSQEVNRDALSVLPAEEAGPLLATLGRLLRGLHD